MKTFGIISEGPTDQIIIDNILVGFFNNEDFLGVRYLQPLRDETDSLAIEKFGGWYKVFEYCRSQNFIEAFEQNDYLIIQIDTDRCEDTHFDVRKSKADGSLVTPLELIEAVTTKFEMIFTEAFGLEKFELFKHRVIYAICVNEIECWLLPLYYDDRTKSSTNNCIHKLNQKISERLGFYIDPSNKSNQVGNYDKISRGYLKNKTLMTSCNHNPSLQVFIQKLIEKNIDLLPA